MKINFNEEIEKIKKDDIREIIIRFNVINEEIKNKQENIEIEKIFEIIACSEPIIDGYIRRYSFSNRIKFLEEDIMMLKNSIFEKISEFDIKKNNNFEAFLKQNIKWKILDFFKKKRIKIKSFNEVKELKDKKYQEYIEEIHDKMDKEKEVCLDYNFLEIAFLNVKALCKEILTLFFYERKKIKEIINILEEKGYPKYEESNISHKKTTCMKKLKEEILKISGRRN